MFATEAGFVRCSHTPARSPEIEPDGVVPSFRANFGPFAADAACEAFGDGRFAASMDDKRGHVEAGQESRHVGEQNTGHAPAQQAHELPGNGKSGEWCVEGFERGDAVGVSGAVGLGRRRTPYGNLPEGELHERRAEFAEEWC